MRSLFLGSLLVFASLVSASSVSTAGSLPKLTTIVSAPGQAVSGTFRQTGIDSLEIRTQGGSTIIDQTSNGSVDGDISGTFEDALNVVIRSNGTFSASFTLVVDCSIDGRSGTLTLKASDVGRMIDPTTAQFTGIATVVGASGGLEGLRGTLDIAGTVDLVSGLSTYDYSGTVQ